MSPIEVKREGAQIVHDIKHCWRLEGPTSDEFANLMDEAADRSDAETILFQACTSLGDDGPEAAREMRRYLAEGEMFFVYGNEKEEYLCETEVLLIPVVGPRTEISKIARDGALSNDLVRLLTGKYLYEPGSQFSLLHTSLTVEDLVSMPPLDIYAIRRYLAAIAFTGCQKQGEMDFRQGAESVARESWGAIDDGHDEGNLHTLSVGFLMAVRVSPVLEGEESTSFDGPCGDVTIADDRYAAWTKEATALLHARGYESLVYAPCDVVSAIPLGLSCFVQHMLCLEMQSARRPDESICWDKLTIVLGQDERLITVTAALNGAVAGPIAVSEKLLEHPIDLGEFTEIMHAYQKISCDSHGEELDLSFAQAGLH